MADPNITPIGCYGQKFRFGSVPFTRSSCTLELDKAVLRAWILEAGCSPVTKGERALIFSKDTVKSYRRQVLIV
jgi:hypothetical protein